MSVLSIPASIYNRLDGYLFESIRDYAHGTPKQRYNIIMEQLVDLNDIPVCGENCKFRPKLSRGTLRKYEFFDEGFECKFRLRGELMKCERPFGFQNRYFGANCVYCATQNLWSYYHYHYDCESDARN